ncbi:MAG: signal transduction histidine kinase [Eubacterium sp.]|jgi:signal transduction histidine kinase|nr:signal transduction histidine kinase [Eubacterium sp.]
MSLRLKLILTYVIMLIITVGIVVLFGVGIITYTMGQAVKSFIGDQSEESAVSRVIDVVVDLRYNQKYSPETLLDHSFAEQIAEQIKVFDGFLVVKNDRQYKAFGTAYADESLYRKLKASQDEDYSKENGISANGMHLNTGKFVWNNEQYFLLKYDFNDADILNYYFVFKIKQSGNITGRQKNILFTGLILLAAIIIGPLLLIITKDIVVPLRKLDKCAQEIARGNLDFHLQSKSNNEIGSVIRSYEKMRFELKKSITSQLEMEENRKQLFSNITHDLKTPITSIKGYIQGIRDGVANDPEKVSKYLDVIYTKTIDMNAMIDDLFLFSKLDLGKEPFNKDYIDIDEFYNNSMQELHLELDGKGVELVAECRIPQGFKVLMDSQKIKRVILNIISNSLKFMDKETKLISLVFEESSGYFVVKIKDNGIGINQNELEKIFDRFYRTDPSRNRNTGGSGLGLAIARQIIEQHNGIIQADSIKGQWTEISFKIPQE